MDPVDSVTGDDTDSVNPVTGNDTREPDYWLNFRFFLCLLWILLAVIESLFLIWRNEGFRKSIIEPQEALPLGTPGTVYMEDTWNTCYKSVHPGVLLGYRLIAFCILLGVILSDSIVNSVGIFYYYTQWTFTLVTIYFGLASVLSVYGCCRGSDPMRNGGAGLDVRDIEIGSNVPQNRRTAGFWGYTIQILYQMSAGAITLTDVVFWLVLYPFVLGIDFKLNILVVCVHSVNAVCYLGDLILNNMKFPFFRIAYFLLFTCVFVILQWILHSCISKDWPYPFLDLSSNAAPLWYLGIGLLHLPCYGLISLIMKAKLCCLTRSQASSYSNG